MKDTVLAYSYETPFLLSSGDHVRIKSIHDFICKERRTKTVFYCLGKGYSVRREDGRTYLEMPRIFDKAIKNILHWMKVASLEENLTKLSQILLDEPFFVMQTSKHLERTKIVFVHGSMSVAPIVLRLKGFKGVIVYDSLANYSQTLYMRAHEGSIFHKAISYIRLAVYLALYRLQLKSSNKVLYPSHLDASNARKMFKLNSKAVVVPNIFISSYTTPSELQNLRKRYRSKYRIDNNSAVLAFCAGFRSKANRDAVNLLVQLDAEELKDNQNLLLIVTGPWLEFQKRGRMPCIFTGSVPRTELNGILAASDVGLAPIFEGSGTLLKVLEYMSAGLPIVATPVAVAGIPESWLVKSRMYLAKDKCDFSLKLHEAIFDNAKANRLPARKDLVSTANDDFTSSLLELLKEAFPK